MTSTTRPDRPYRTALGDMPIPETGSRGFLKWARREYPAAVYQKVAEAFQQRFPQAFSGYMLGGWRTTARLSGFADSTPTVDTADAANSDAMQTDWGAFLQQLIGTSTAAYLDVKQQQQNQQLLNAQIQQAQNGQKPLPISLSANGITFTPAGAAAGGVGVAVLVGVGYLIAKRLGVFK